MPGDIPRVYDDVASSSRRAPVSQLAQAEAHHRVGSTLVGKYRLDRLLGVGGMAYVFGATNEASGHVVAIKMLQTPFAAQEDVVARFMREARTANLIRHPNVVEVFDVGKDEHGVPYLVQELLVGESLMTYLDRNGGSLSAETVVETMVPVLDALENAHSKGVVHRDVKPENVFLVGEKRVPKLLDFGISKVRMPGTEATAVGVLLGTPAYMPPELIRDAREADQRTDIWACGVMMFELLTGICPFRGDNIAQLFQAILTEQPRKLAEVRPELPATLGKIIDRCLMRSPADRYPAIGPLAADLRSALDRARKERESRADEAGLAATLQVEQGLPRRDVAPPPGEQRQKRHLSKIELGAIALAVLLAVVAAALMLTRGR